LLFEKGKNKDNSGDLFGACITELL